MKSIDNILGVLKETGGSYEKFCFKPLVQILQKAVFLKMSVITLGLIPLSQEMVFNLIFYKFNLCQVE